MVDFESRFQIFQAFSEEPFGHEPPRSSDRFGLIGRLIAPGLLVLVCFIAAIYWLSDRRPAANDARLEHYDRHPTQNPGDLPGRIGSSAF